MQILPALESGGVERGTLEVGAELVRQGHRSLVVSAGGRLVPRLLAEGSQHFDWNVGRKSLGTLRWIRPLRRLLIEQQVDVLHARSRLPAWIAWLAWRGLPAANRPAFVTTVHGLYTVNAYSAIMTRGEQVIAVSESVRDYIFANYPKVQPQKVQVIHRGVDPAAYPYGYRPQGSWLENWYREYPHLQDRFVVTLPGRLTRWKGHEDFLDVIARLKAKGVPVTGVMAGGAHPRKQQYLQELEQRIQREGLEQETLLTGHRDDLREILAVSDVVLSLSHQPEAFGRTTIEALSLGRPVCGYAHGGVGEQLEAVFPQGAVAPFDSAAVAARLHDWFEHPPRVRDDHPFTLQNMLAQTLAVYALAASGHSV